MTLEEVSQLFTVWRSSNQCHNRLLPKQLLEKAKLLQPQHSRAKICKELQISYFQFNKHCEPSSGNTVLSEQENFVETSLSIAPPLMCELILQGARRTLTLKVPETQLNHLLPLLEAYL